MLVTGLPIFSALWFRSRSAQSDYATEWWAVLAALAVSVAVISAMLLLRHRPMGRSLAIAAMLTVAAASTYEAVVGLCQIAGLVPSAHSSFPLTGTFYNPGPYGGFVAMGLPIGLSLSLERVRWQQWTGLVVVMLALVVLPASASRSAWVAGAVSCGFMAVCHRRVAVSAWLRRWWLPLTVGLIAAFVGAYLLKADSANGRLLMWRIGLRACSAHPWGVGWHSVSAAYGDAQEVYFASGSGSAAEIAVAGTPEYLFNEYLQVALAWGWAAGALFVGVLAATIIGAVRSRLYGIGGAVIAFGVFAFSSYPLQFPIFVAAVALLTLSVAVSVCRSPWSRKMSGVACLAVAVLIGLAAVSHHAKADAYQRWLRTRYLYRSSSQSAAVKAMTAFGDTLAWNPNFMFELGHSLNLTGDYRESNRVLADAAKVCGDPMIYNLRGKNFQALGRADSALHELTRAADRLPNRMYPHYLMVRLAAEADPVDTALLRREATIVLTMPVKVMSPAIREMRDSTKSIIQKINTPPSR